MARVKRSGKGAGWWAVFAISGAAVALVAMKKIREGQPDNLAKILDAAERAARALDERLNSEIRQAS